MSTQLESTCDRTSRKISNSPNSIADASDSLSDALLPPCSAVQNAGTLKEEPEPPGNIFHVSWRGIRRRLPDGWRFGALVGTILSLCALVGNILVLVIVSNSVNNKNGSASTFTTIREGSCSDIEDIQLKIHLVINAVSTLLLGASNYCMQCLSAPTRAEVNSAHNQGKYLDIGVPSLRNLGIIGRGRLFCWLLLGLSSLPLHLVYNSTFYVSLTNNSYDIYFASPDFQNGEWFDSGLFRDLHRSKRGARNITIRYPNGTFAAETKITLEYLTLPSTVQQQVQSLGVQLNGSMFERLENSDCIEAYAKTPLSDRRTLILVSSTMPRDNHHLDKSIIIDKHFLPKTEYHTYGNCTTSLGLPISGTESIVSCLTNSSLYTLTSYRSGLLPSKLPDISNWFYWICSQNAMYSEGEIDMRSLCSNGHWQTIKSNASQWTVGGFRIDYCISERLEHGCKMNMAGKLLIVVISFNAMKVIIMAVIVWKTHDDQLITIGDAAASFIQQPDRATKGMCLYSREDFNHSFSRVDGDPKAKLFEPRAKRRATAVSRRRWIFAIFLILAGLGVILGLLGYAVNDLKSRYGFEGFRSLWDLGLGTLNGSTLIIGWGLPTSGDGAVISAVLVANLPQALFSMLYLLINSLFTNFSQATEWSRYANRSTPLRVSKPRGNQRSTYFLQVPYRLAIPLMGFSALLHWIMSQSIFFSQVDAKNQTGAPSGYRDTDSPPTCSYSPLGMIITVIAGFALIVFAAALGWRKLQSGIPLAGSCSAAISAACHTPERTSALLEVMWGVIPDIKEETEEGEQIGHCGFSNDPVEAPVEGNLYA